MVKKAAEATPNQHLRAARKERNWTQQEVADRIGSPQSFNISRWEQGTAFPSAHYIQQLCLLFGKSAKELGLLLEDTTERLEPTTEEASAPLWNVPFRRNPFFTGREEVLTHLHDRFTASRTVALTQTQTISGLGGIGKTQIAVEYAYRYREEFNAVLWVRAASRDVLISDFATLASLLHLPEQNEQDQNIVVSAVKRWLVHHQGWMLILDNADELELAAEFLPTGDNGHLLLTTRAQATGSIAPSIVIEKMEQDEGLLLLLRRAKLLVPDASIEQVNEEERTRTLAIVEALDGLPLALDQAGAYIEETGCSLAGYLALYRTHRKELLQRRSTLRADHPDPVAFTWALSFQKVEQANPAAADLLRLCAFLDPDAIPEEIITEGASLLGSVLGAAATDSLQWNEAIQVLRRYSLVKRDREARLLNIHRLVQVVLRDEMDEQTQRQWAERAVRVVNAVLPVAEFANWHRCQEYLPHAQVCAELIEQHSFTFPEAAQLIAHAGWYLRERGLYTLAELLLSRALVMREEALGPEHPDSVDIFDVLGIVYRDLGQYEQAAPLLWQALTIREKTMGSEHPDTASTLDNLAELYRSQGHYDQAEPLFERSQAIREKVLGFEHPETVTGLSNLGHLYENQGRYAQAASLYQRALTIEEKVMHPEHPQIAATLNNLAIVYRKQGKYEAAEPLYQRSLTIKEKGLGPEHPITIFTLDNLGQLYTYQGRYEQAEPLHQHALAVFEKVLGLEHLDTAISLTNLANLYQALGRYEQAEPLYQRALVIKEKRLGSEHPNTAINLHSLACIYRDQGHYQQAELLYQRALRIRVQTLGPEHPDVAQSLNGLASLYSKQGKYGEAESLYQRALRIREQVLGPEHPDVAETLHDLASFQQAQGKLVEAISLYQRAFAIREQVLGPEHPDTVVVRESYTSLLEEVKQKAEAAKREDSG